MSKQQPKPISTNRKSALDEKRGGSPGSRKPGTSAKPPANNSNNNPNR